MSIYFTCANCGRPFDVAEETVGQTFTCDVCEASLMVPATSQPRPEQEGELSVRQFKKLIRFVAIFFVLAFSAGTIGQFWTLLWDDPLAKQAEESKLRAVNAKRKAEFEVRNAVENRLPNIAYPDLPPPGAFTETPPFNFPTTWVQSKTGEGPGSRMQLRIYLPPGEHADKTLSCVVMPPARANVVAGYPVFPTASFFEAKPFVEAGYVVIVFSLDGQLPKDAFDLPKDEYKKYLNRARKRFDDACFGVANGRAAIEYAVRNLPQVDPQQIYVAGIEAAGSAALLLAENEPRLAGCIALAPCIDIEERAREYLSPWDSVDREQLPSSHADRIQCPVFLFDGKGDPAETIDEIPFFYELLKEHHVNVTLDQVESKDMEGSIMDIGVSHAVDWLKQQADPMKDNSEQPEPTPPSVDD
ncbi:alpha/beta hydrolase family protein [Blastopirellula marina]|uniref:Peptidase S9 prolyl oligopeptidase catalytic domain-containing protein n=1 Tax=Blastopirellula marina DSM 3645 TaxID=314230 RepID=A3ZND0_9BACT|nr:hypothetical protein [Blastopirellula marina]EAQ81825.1 hypothetical protein DSM3645_16775 [Blastopirellula marina DSM 3645]